MDARNEITGYLKKRGISLVWLSKSSTIKYNSLYAILKLKTTKLSKDRLTLINKALQTKFKL